MGKKDNKDLGFGIQGSEKKPESGVPAVREDGSPHASGEPSPSQAVPAADDFGGVKFDALRGIAKLEEYSGGESLLGLSVAILGIIREKVDPEITADNPVEHWAVADDHCTFVFRDGRKVRVSL